MGVPLARVWLLWEHPPEPGVASCLALSAVPARESLPVELRQLQLEPEPELEQQRVAWVPVPQVAEEQQAPLGRECREWG